VQLRYTFGPVVAAALAAGLLASACGGSAAPPHRPAKTTPDILKEMQAAVKAAKSVHMTGTVMSGSQKITFDMSFYGRSDMSGTFDEGTGTASLLIVGASTYVKASSAFLKSAKLPASLCGTICGKYIELPASDKSAITGSLSMSALSTQAFGKLPMSAAKDASEFFVHASYDGNPVLKISSKGYTLEVAGTGTPYPVLVEAPGGETVVFSQWNAVPTPAVPPASQVVNLSQL
jgi:hypothetical protein